jgi:hypothetical protein
MFSFSSFYIRVEDFEKTVEWWNEVSQHVPGLLTITLLLDSYFMLFFNHLKEISKEIKRVRK